MALVALSLLGLSSCLPTPPSHSGGGINITVYGFSIMKESLEKSIYPAFSAKWKSEHGADVRFTSSFAGSETITNQILQGVKAQIAILSIERDVRESGNLYFPWLVKSQGELTLCTASLMERDRPYHLTVELARGTLNRLRNQVDVWESGGATIPQACRQLTHEATLSLAQAAIGQLEPQLQRLRTGIAADNLTQRRETLQPVLVLAHADQHSVRVAGRKLVEWDQFVDDEVCFLAARPTIDHSTK